MRAHVYLFFRSFLHSFAQARAFGFVPQADSRGFRYLA